MSFNYNFAMNMQAKRRARRASNGADELISPSCESYLRRCTRARLDARVRDYSGYQQRGERIFATDGVGFRRNDQ